MQDLFDEAPPEPLAQELRPQSLEDILGQQHLVAPGKPLHSAYTQGHRQSFLLWGPPGVGKTSLALMAGKYFGMDLIELSGVSTGAKEIKETLEQIHQMWRLHKKPVLLFIDEIHRLTRPNQDLLLPGLEKGAFYLVAATTEAPQVELSSALLSRIRVYALKPLQEQDLEPVLQKAYRSLGSQIHLTQDAKKALLSRSQGDARSLITNLEIVLAAAASDSRTEVDEEYLNGVSGDTVQRFGKFNSDFYHTISAFQKSIRGSNADGALYWMARMLRGGTEPKYLARRMMVIASEDIGLADPQAIVMASQATVAVEKVGMPECGIILAEIACYLALAPKSNASYKAWRAVNKFLDKNPVGEVPPHLQDTAVGYRYSHSEPGSFSAGQSFLPEELGTEFWLSPDSFEQLEEHVAKEEQWALDKSSPNTDLQAHLRKLSRLRGIDIWGT